MRAVRLTIFLVMVSLLLVSAYQLTRRAFNESDQNRKLSEICEVITGDIQTGSTLRAAESANSAFSANFHDVPFLIQIKDSLNPYGRALTEAEKSVYRRVDCKVSGQSAGEVIFWIERKPIVSASFGILVGVTFVVLLALWFTMGHALRELSLAAQSKFNLEIQKALGLTAELPSRGFVGRFLERTLQSDSSRGESLKSAVLSLKEKITEQQHQFAGLREVQVRTELELRKNEKFIEMVRQVRHDIRGPLQTLRLMMEEKRDRGFEGKRIGAIVTSIQEMIQDLEIQEEMADTSKDGMVLHVAEAIVQEVVHQKQIIFNQQDVSISFEVLPEFLSLVRIQPSHFRRLIGNLLQNSFEAFENQIGKIQVECIQESNAVAIKIKDSGRGISETIQAKLFVAGFTFGKERGSGLGLSHAKSCIEKWGGKIEMESQEGIGTTVTIRLPLEKTQSRFVSRFPAANPSVNVVLDDDPESFQKISAFLKGPSLFCASLEEFKARSGAIPVGDDVQYVFDYNLGTKSTGLDVLRATPVRRRPHVLATSDYDRPEVIQASLDGIYILPKVFLG